MAGDAEYWLTHKTILPNFRLQRGFYGKTLKAPDYECRWKNHSKVPECSLTYTETPNKLFISNNGIIMGYL